MILAEVLTATGDVLLSVGLTTVLGMLGWLLLSVNKLLVRQAVNIRNVSLDEQALKDLSTKVELLSRKVDEFTQTGEELTRALEDFHATLAQFVRKGDVK